MRQGEVMNVLKLLDQGDEAAAAAACHGSLELQAAMRLELRAAEGTLANPPQACGVPGAAELAKLLAGQLRGDVLHFLVRRVPDPALDSQLGVALDQANSCYCQTFKLSEKERKQAIRALESVGQRLAGSFSWSAWEGQSGKRRTFYLTCRKHLRADQAAVQAATARAAALRRVLQAVGAAQQPAAEPAAEAAPVAAAASPPAELATAPACEAQPAAAAEAELQAPQTAATVPDLAEEAAAAPEAAKAALATQPLQTLVENQQQPASTAGQKGQRRLQQAAAAGDKRLPLHQHRIAAAAGDAENENASLDAAKRPKQEKEQQQEATGVPAARRRSARQSQRATRLLR